MKHRGGVLGSASGQILQAVLQSLPLTADAMEARCVPVPRACVLLLVPVCAGAGVAGRREIAHPPAFCAVFFLRPAGTYTRRC